MTAAENDGVRPIGHMVEACIAAHEAVLRQGTWEMQQLTERLLLELGRAIASGTLRTGHEVEERHEVRQPARSETKFL